MVVHCLALFPIPLPHNRLACDMPETLSEVKARVIRQQQERTDERIRELRRERRENIVRESVGEVRVRAREEQRLRTEARVKHWQKVEDWVERDCRRVWVVRLSCNLVWFLSWGPVDVERVGRYSFLLCPSHNVFPRLGERTYLSHWVREEERGELEAEGPH